MTGLLDDLFDPNEDEKEEPVSMTDIFGPEPKEDPAAIDPQPTEQPTASALEPTPVPEPVSAVDAIETADGESVDAELKMFWENKASDLPQLGGTAGLFQATSPDFFSVSGEETRAQFNGAKLAYETANLGMEAGDIGYRVMTGNASEKDTARLKEINARQMEIQKLVDEDVTISEAFATFAPYLIKSATEGGKGAMIGGMMGATMGGILGNMIPGAQAAPEEILTIPAGFTLGAKVGAAYGSADAIRKVEAGNAFLGMIQDGVDVETAKITGHTIGVINGGLEALQFGLLGKAIPKPLVNKITQKATVAFFKSPAARSLLKRVGALGAEVATEDIQELVTLYGEHVSKAISEERGVVEGLGDVKPEEVYETVLKTSEITAKGLLPMFVPGGAADVARSAGETLPSGADVSDIINEANVDEQVKKTQPIKANDIPTAEGPNYEVRTAGNGKLVVIDNQYSDIIEEQIEDQGTPASQDFSRTASMLDDLETPTNVQERNLGGQTELQDSTGLSENETATRLSEETQGQMGIKLHGAKAAQSIDDYDSLQFEIEQMFEQDNYVGARELINEQQKVAGELEGHYNETLKAYSTKAKGQNVEPNPNVQKALDRDLAHRIDNAKKNDSIARDNIARQNREQHQALIDGLKKPEQYRSVVWNEQITQKNRGNSTGAKLYDRMLKEFNLHENLGEFDYLDRADVKKLSDLQTDLGTYQRELTQGSREYEIVESSINKLENMILQKKGWDIKKGRAEIDDAKAQQRAKGKTAVRRKTQGAKDVVGTGVRPATRKAEKATAQKAKDVAARKAAVQKQQEQVRQEDSRLKRLRDERLNKKEKQAEEAKQEAEHKAAIQKLRDANPDLTDADVNKIEKMEIPNIEKQPAKTVFQRLAGDNVRVDALGQDGTTTPGDQVQVTVMKGPAKGATFNVPKKNFTKEVRRIVKEAEEARGARVSPPAGTVNAFRFSDGSVLEGTDSGDIYNKANAQQKAEMESGKAVEGFRQPGKDFVERMEAPKQAPRVRDLKDTTKTFGILTAENPMGKAQPEAKNRLANQRLGAELKSAGFNVAQVEGQYGNLEKPFLVEGIDQKTLSALGKKYGQESVIHMEGNKAVYLEGNKVVDTVDRSTIRKSPEATDFYTKLPDGTKFQIPFFEEAMATAEDNNIILDLTNLRAQGQDFVTLMEEFAKHMKRGPRSWLHELAKKGGAKYFFVDGERGLEANAEFQKLGMKTREKILQGYDKTLGIYTGSGTYVNGIFINMNTILGKLQDLDKAFEVLDHEALHAVVTQIYGKSSQAARARIRAELDALWNTIPETMKEAKFDLEANGWRIGNLFIPKDADGIGEAQVRHLQTGIRQSDKDVDEIVTHGFTNPIFAKWLNSMSSEFDFGAPKKETLWQKLKGLVAEKILRKPSKLDDVAAIMDQNLEALDDVNIRFSKTAKRAGGMSNAKALSSVRAIQKKAPNAAKAKVVGTEDKLPKHLQLSQKARDEGVVVESVWDEETDTVYFVSSNIKNEAHLLKKWMHENVAHKGLRTIFPSKAQLLKFLDEARGVLFKAGKGKELDQVSLMYHNKRFVETTAKEKYETVEEYLALNFAEKLDLKTRKGLLKKLIDALKRWLPSQFFDKKAAKAGTLLTEADLMTVMEAAKHGIMGKQPKLAEAITKAFAKRAPRVPSSITDKVNFQKTAKQYAQLVKDVMAELPDAKQWYPAHLQRLEKVFGRDGLLFNLLLSITSPQSTVVENIGHAVDTYLYMLGYKDRPGGVYWPQVQDKVDGWRSEADVLAGIGGKFKINEFVRGLLGDKNATVLDIWMHRLFFGADAKAPGQEAFGTSESQAGRQMLFEIAKVMESETGQQWSPRDIQAVLWTWVKAKQEGTSFKDVPNFETGFIEPRDKYNGRTALEELHKYIKPEDIVVGPLSDKLQMTGFRPTELSRMEKSRMLQMSRVPHLAKVAPVKGEAGSFANSEGTAGFTVDENTGEISNVFSKLDEPGIYTEMVVQAIVKGGRWTWAPLNFAAAYEQAGFIFDFDEAGTGDLAKAYIPDHVVDSYRNKNGKVTANLVRQSLGGTQLDLEPRTEHRYSLAKIEDSDSQIIDEDGLFQDGRPVFLDKLFEWKDGADLNAQREIMKLEQDFLQEFGGSKAIGSQLPVVGRISSGMLTNNSKTRLLQKAMNLYIDSGVGRGLEKVKEYAEELRSKKKKTNVEKDRLKIMDRMLEMTDAEKAWADNNIRVWYDDMYNFAQSRGLLDTYVDGYVRRAWKVPDGFAVTGAANTGQTAGSFSNFSLTTPRGKQRSFKSIIDGWKMGTDWSLKNDAVLTNLSTYMTEISEVATNKRFINYMKGLTDPKGNGIIQENISERKAKEQGLVELKARGFAPPFKKVFARPDIGVVLNKVAEDGEASLWRLPGVKAILKLNAMIKGMVLSISAFHHLAGLRSFNYGVVEGWRHSSIGAFKRGLRKIEDKTEMAETRPYGIGATVDYLVKSGLTLGRVQDWDQKVLAAENSLIEKILRNRTGAISRALLNLKRATRHGREKWTRSLFNRLFSGLKAESAALEFAHAIQKQEKKKKRGLTEAELKHEATKVARLINADFGGLHLKRMGRNPNLQKVAQLFLLAPDWTESNFRTVTGMIPGLNDWINSKIGDFKGPAGMGKTYRTFWRGIAFKMIASYILFYSGMWLIADDEDKELMAERLATEGQNFKDVFLEGEIEKINEIAKARWTAIPVDPLLNRFKSEENKIRQDQRGFKLGGHFFDILKVFEPDKLLMHKGSPIVRTGTSLISGRDWKDAPFTSASELVTKWKTVSKGGRFEKTRGFYERLPSWAVSELIGATPIYTQEFLRYTMGESSTLELLRTGGADIRVLRDRNVAMEEYSEIQSEINAIERDIRAAKAGKSKEAKAAAQQRMADFKYNYNRTKSRLGYAKAKLRKVNSKIRAIEIKEKLGKELTPDEQNKLKDLKDQKQRIVEQFLEKVKGSK